MRNHAEAMVEDFPEASALQLIGYNYRLTDLEAAVAIEQFKKLEGFNIKKLSLANKFSGRLMNIEGPEGALIKRIPKKTLYLFIL